MQKVEPGALVPGTVYEIVDRGRDPANGFYAKGTFSEPDPREGNLLVFKNVIVPSFFGGGNVQATVRFDKRHMDFYRSQQQPEPPSRGGRRKRRTHRRRNGKKHVVRRRRMTRKH